MAIVKISDVTSKSQNVIDLFTLYIGNRTLEWLQSYRYTNDELLEILKISETIERDGNRTFFHSQLIVSQPGPFNFEVFQSYCNATFYETALVHLLKHTPGLTEADKITWITRVFNSSPSWCTNEFFPSGKASNYGIDIRQFPYNSTIATRVITYYPITSFNTSTSEALLLWRVLDSMDEITQMSWYNDIPYPLRDIKVNHIVTLYPNASAPMLSTVYHASNKVVFKRHIVSHKNCPMSIKLDLYDNYGDTNHLSSVIQTLFIF